jgi:hypothetical protein
MSDYQERLDGENGFLLAPHIDKGWVSSTDERGLLVKDEALKVVSAWHIELDISVGYFSRKECQFL